MEYNEIKKHITAIVKFIIKLTKIAALSLAAVCLLIAAIVLLYCYITRPPMNNFDKRVWWEYYWEKDDNGECIIDLNEVISVKWDSAIVYTGAYEYEDICKDLGFNLREYTTMGDRIIFMRNGYVVYYAEWFPYPPEYAPKTVAICHPGDKYVIYPHDAKFKAGKTLFYNSEDKYLFLKKVEH